jgi:outer membrane protein TolC
MEPFLRSCTISKTVLRLIFILLPSLVFAQEQKTISLSEAFKIAEEQYPLTKQKELLKQAESLTIQNLNTGYLPQVFLNAQDSYQSDVTKVSVPLPGIKIPEQPKNQYKAVAEVNQLLFDGGMIRSQKEVQALNTAVEQNKIAVELFNLKTRIHQIYFSILYHDELLKQASLNLKDVEAGIEKVKPQVENGVILRSNLQLLQVQQLQVEQKKIEITMSRKGLSDALALYLNLPAGSKLDLEIPEFILSPDTIVSRPEISLFESQSKLIAGQKELINAKNLPKANAFVQGGYGRPGLNMLSNEFKSFYIAGVKVIWPLGGLYTKNREKKIIDISQEGIGLQKETFIVNTRMQLQQQRAEISKYQALVAADEQIINLRHSITEAAKAQLENAVITTNDYLLQINAEDAARQTAIIHRLQLLQAETNYAITSGKL